MEASVLRNLSSSVYLPNLLQINLSGWWADLNASGLLGRICITQLQIWRLCFKILSYHPQSLRYRETVEPIDNYTHIKKLLLMHAAPWDWRARLHINYDALFKARALICVCASSGPFSSAALLGPGEHTFLQLCWPPAVSPWIIKPLNKPFFTKANSIYWKWSLCYYSTCWNLK